MSKIKDKKLTVLVILDGFGLTGFKNIGNAITPKTAPNIFKYIKKYPSTELKASGVSVGLRSGQKGNSEAGHFNIGAGRIVEQDLMIISKAIKDGTFFKNLAFKQALFHAKKYNSTVHIFGLLTNGHSAHACPDHLYELLNFFRREEYKKISLHLFTDGRDAPPNSAIKYLKKLKKYLKNGEKIASISGRFYSMDRNKVWERTEKTYNLIVSGEAKYTAVSAEEAINKAYKRGETDEFIHPTVLINKKRKPISKIKDNDVVYFYNARSDRARQLTKAFVQKDFIKHNKGAFKRKNKPKNIRFVAMTDFGPDLEGVLTAFPSPDIKMPLAKAIGEEYKQLYISETEKYAHITYFINGGYAGAVNGEDREMIRSGCHYSYSEKPQMHCKNLTSIILDYIKKDKYNFICVNYPNADIVAHTGNFKSAKKALGFLDKQIKRLVKGVLKKNGQVLIIADHGNAEEMIYKKTKGVRTEHTTNPVPCIFIKKKVKDIELKTGGKLADVAPTLLKIMDIKKPKEMTGKSLI
ncbi:MAG: 2,3-bisphosphoglycerate-independent phosphoglycerate mutase [Candidatus Magasanikbacteria bacterium]|nr:2,3-bisphosphoglycerate-independent phosphoglycerate mutase [Candidatus Magasanikbacteria bacterium]